MHTSTHTHVYTPARLYQLAVLKFPNVIRLKEDAYNAETFETNKELAYAYFIRWRWAQDQVGR